MRGGGVEMETKRKSRTVTVTVPAMEYVIRVTTLVPVDREDMCREIVENVYGPVDAVIESYGPKDERR